jgi:hypothetical protein
LSSLLTARDSAGAWIWRILAWQTFQRGEVAVALKAIDRALALSQADWDRADIHWTRSWILRHTNPKEALESAVQTLLLDRREERFVQLVLAGIEDSSISMLRECLEKMNIPGEQRGQIEAVYLEAADTATYLSTLESHLREIVAISRAHGAEVVFLSYPFPSLEIERVVMRVAKETGSGWVDVRPEFEKLLASNPREKFFVQDGHLSDDGYGILADLVAGKLAPLLSQRN